MTLANLRAAARLAREASQGRRAIAIDVIETGIVVRGWTTGVGQKTPVRREVAWSDLSSPADLASNAVELVDRELSAMEGAA